MVASKADVRAALTVDSLAGDSGHSKVANWVAYWVDSMDCPKVAHSVAKRADSTVVAKVVTKAALRGSQKAVMKES